MQRTRRHLLAIDRDMIMLGVYRELLMDEGYRVTTRLSADTTIDEIADLNPDLIILDDDQTDDGERSLFHQVRRHPETSAIPVVLCTGAVTDLDAVAIQLIAQRARLVTKPFNVEELVETVAEILTR